ncbi:MAG: aminotransferase class I/II-fold pyridoxal phosphate-dependent enzyme [Pseudomonadota bacterium]
MKSHPADSAADVRPTNTPSSGRYRVRPEFVLLPSVLLAACVSFVVSYLVRFDFTLPEPWYSQCLLLVPFVGVIKAVLFFPFRAHANNWRYFGLPDGLFLGYYSTICSAVLLAGTLLGPSFHIPRGVVAVDFMLTTVLVGIIGISMRLSHERLGPSFLSRRGPQARRAVVLGAGDPAEALIRETVRSRDAGIVIEAVFDDDTSQTGGLVYGVRVKGTLDHLEAYLQTNDIDTVFMAIPSPNRNQMARINKVLAQLNISVKVVRPLLDIVDKGPAIERLDETGVFAFVSGQEDVHLVPASMAEDPAAHIPLVRPSLPEMEDVFKAVKESYDSGIITTGKIVKDFEEELQRFTGVKHAIAVSSCTSGLMLVFSAMDSSEGSEVVVPSFTFAATIQALLWNRLTPVYVDCIPGTMTVDPDEVEKAIGPKTAAIYPVTVFGLPPDLDRLEEISSRCNIPLICDSAQGLGATYKGRPAGGFGACEVFSLSPGKVITAMEGGVITTNDDALASRLRSMRDYGKSPDGQTMIFKGLSARMVEFDAAVGLLNLRAAETLISARLRLIRNYRSRLERLPGYEHQEFPADRTTSGSHFAFRVVDGARTDREGVFEALKAHNIQSKKYFYPPCHAQPAFRDRLHRVVGDLHNTWLCSTTCLALPLYSHMSEGLQDRVCKVVESELSR